ncbi:FMN-binding negative transcriptional regulator [Pelomonas sp. KK5]|uniref:FMN-binding negative transcriptional regulator n=1 Tax=Pelomonas sp. KK5 TaxID=1855730 RepID=UPI00097BE8BB|nr:FMN-binding negative transcriptional regulator [Pelomonas sp. KK5]
MYNPKHFATQDLTLALALIAEAPLGLLVGPDAEGASFGTHVPMFALPDTGDALVLEGHMARANPHWGWLSAQRKVLAIFSLPGAYVSPRFYDSEKNVPTWNYAAVHAQGEVELVDDPAEKDALLKRLIARHEPPYAEQWKGLPEDYHQKMLAAIVGFRIRVTRWEAKLKLSQNRAAGERARIMAAFKDGTPPEQALAAWMDRLGL